MLEKFIKLVNNAPLNEWIGLESMKYTLKRVQFKYDEGEGYIWVGELSYKNSGRSGWIYPMKDANYVKYFKTINGMKRNFLKRYNQKR